MVWWSSRGWSSQVVRDRLVDLARRTIRNLILCSTYPWSEDGICTSLSLCLSRKHLDQDAITRSTLHVPRRQLLTPSERAPLPPLLPPRRCPSEVTFHLTQFSLADKSDWLCLLQYDQVWTIFFPYTLSEPQALVRPWHFITFYRAASFKAKLSMMMPQRAKGLLLLGHSDVDPAMAYEALSSRSNVYLLGGYELVH